MIYPPEGIIINSASNRAYLKSPDDLERAYRDGAVLESIAEVCTQSHDLITALPKMRGIMPREEVSIGIREGTTKEIAIISRVGRPVCFTIEGFELLGGERVAMLSRRRAQKRCIDEYLLPLRSGEVIDAAVTHIERFGCFVDIGLGIPSMIPINEISISRISSPADRFAVGDRIKVIYKGYRDDKFYIGHKELLGTWLENAELFSPGETVKGIVRSVEEYGVFVELMPNLAGLAEPDGKISSESLSPGQPVSVYIKSINPEKMKVKLIIVAAGEAVEDKSAGKDFLDRTRGGYFITSGRIKSWRYSPAGCQRLIMSAFDDKTES